MKNALKEINRILKPGGKLILATVNRKSLFRRISLISKHPKKKFGEHNIFSINGVTKLLNMSGFKIKKIFGSDFMPMPKDLSSNLMVVTIKI